MQYGNININYPRSSRVINGSYSITQDITLVIVDTIGLVSPPTITLPDAREVDGQIFTIKIPVASVVSSGQNVIIAGSNGQTIDGSGSVTVTINQTAISVQSDNANWIIVSNSGSSSNVLPSGFYSASDYVTSSGNTTSAIQRAVDDAESSTNGGTIIVPAGDWAFDSQITVPNHVHIVGAGNRSTRIIGTAAIPVFVLGTDSYAISPVNNQISIQSLRIDGTFTGGGIVISSVQNGYLGDLDVRCGGTPSPFCIQIKNESRYVMVERCDVRDADWCIRIENGFRSVQCFMSRFRCVGGTSRNGIFMGGGVDAGGSNSVINYCEVSGFGGIGIHVDGTLNAVDQPVFMFNRLESSQAGTPPAIQTDGTVIRPFGFTNYYGSGASVTNVQDNSGTFEEVRQAGMAPEIRYIDDFQPSTFRRIKTGSGDPNGSAVGSPGDMYTNASGGAGATLWIKESGAGTDTGWVAK